MIHNFLILFQALKLEVDVMKRKVSDLESEVVDYQKLNEENNDAYKNQVS